MNEKFQAKLASNTLTPRSRMIKRIIKGMFFGGLALIVLFIISTLIMGAVGMVDLMATPPLWFPFVVVIYCVIWWINAMIYFVVDGYSPYHNY
jgi:hypothetical protein